MRDTLPASPDAPRSLLGIFCAIWSGLIITELVTDNLLPLTLRGFTTNAGVIGMILATKPLFGFLAQPIVGILGDRIWTRFGRRACFLIVGAPIVAICLVAIPHLTIFWQVVVVVVIYQFFQDVSWGSDHPLMADLIPAQQRTLLMGLILTTSQILAFVFLKVGMGWCIGRYGSGCLYYIAASAQIVFVMGAAFLLNEKPPEPHVHARLTPRRYVTDFLGQPMLGRFALLAFFQGLGKYMVAGFVVMFAVHTIGLTAAQFGGAWSIQALLQLGGALLLGVIIERWVPKQLALAAGYGLMASACCFGLRAAALPDFTLIAILFGLGLTIIEVTQKPFFTEHLPRAIIGQLSGAYNLCFALGRTIAMAGGGWLIQGLGNDYRAIWITAMVAAVTAAAIALTIPDRRFAARRALVTQA